jgi:hypothetical protein
VGAQKSGTPRVRTLGAPRLSLCFPCPPGTAYSGCSARSRQPVALAISPSCGTSPPPGLAEGRDSGAIPAGFHIHIHLEHKTLPPYPNGSAPRRRGPSPSLAVAGSFLSEFWPPSRFPSRACRHPLRGSLAPVFRWEESRGSIKRGNFSLAPPARTPTESRDFRRQKSPAGFDTGICQHPKLP